MGPHNVIGYLDGGFTYNLRVGVFPFFLVDLIITIYINISSLP